MPIAYKCLRCGSYYDDNGHAYQHQSGRYRLYQTHEILEDRRVDLCPDCHERFSILVDHWFVTELVMRELVDNVKPEVTKKKGWWRK